MDIKGHTFEFNGGGITNEGKTHWPDCVNFSAPPHIAWNLVRSLLSQLEEGTEMVEFSGCGKLDYDEDQG